MDSVQKDHIKEEPNILDVYQQIIECQAKEADEFLNNKYAPRRQNTNNIFPDDSEFLTFAFINNEIALDQYIKDQRKRQKSIKSGKLRVNYNQEFSNRYIPGKRSTNFPTTSFLTKNQMTAAYHHYMTHKTHKEVFAAQILEEIEEFQAYAQQMWRKVNYQRAVDLDPNVKAIIDAYWETKICAAKSVYPSSYGLVSTVPLTLSEEDSKLIHLAHVSDLHTEGTYHQINEIIRVEQEYHLSTCSKDMTAWLQFEQKSANSVDMTNRLDEDEAAESLAVMKNAQVVMTTSSVKTLLNNHSENHYAASWMLPVHIKLVVDPNTGVEKKIIFLDKKLTHKTLTNTQKLAWFSKLAAKKFCFDYSNVPKPDETELQNQRPQQRMERKRKREKSSERGSNEINVLERKRKREKSSERGGSTRSDEVNVKNNEFLESRTGEIKSTENSTVTQRTGNSTVTQSTGNSTVTQSTGNSTVTPSTGNSIRTQSTENSIRTQSTGNSTVTQSTKPCQINSSEEKSDVPSQTCDLLRDQVESLVSLNNAYTSNSNSDEIDNDGRRSNLKSSPEITSSPNEEEKKKLSCDASYDDDTDEDEGLRIDLSEDEFSVKEPSSPICSMQSQGETISSHEQMIAQAKAKDSNTNQLLETSCLNSGDSDSKLNPSHVSQQNNNQSTETSCSGDINSKLNPSHVSQQTNNQTETSCSGDTNSKLNPSHVSQQNNNQTETSCSGDTNSKLNLSDVSQQHSYPKSKPLESVDYSRLTSNGRNQTYALWKLFQEHSPGSELLKNTRHPLNIIIRSKQDGRKSNGARGYVCIAPKVEYQCEYGAEVSSLHDLLGEWASLYIRPNTDLLRVRVAHDNLEVIMSELRRCTDLSHLLQLQYRLNPRHCLGNLQAVLWRLMELPPGRYLLSHEPRHNAFVNVLRADPKGSHLPMAGWQCTEGIGRATWRPLDPALVTPSHFFSKTLPVLFPPSSQGVAMKQNHKKQKNETYKKHLADLKMKQKKETNKKKREKKIAAQKKKKKASDEIAGKQRAAQNDSSQS